MKKISAKFINPQKIEQADMASEAGGIWAHFS